MQRSLASRACSSTRSSTRSRSIQLGADRASTGTASPTWSPSRLFLWLAALRARQPQFAAARLDAARRRGPAVLRRARRGHRRPARLRAVLQAGLLRRPIRSRSSRCGRAACRSTAGCSACSARWRCSRAARERPFLEVTDLIAPCVPTRPRRRAHRQLHQRRAVGPRGRSVACRGRWCFRSRARTCRAIRRSSTSSRSKACCCSCCCGCTRASRGALGAGVGRVPRRLRRASASSPSTSASPTLPRPARARHEHGPVAVRADGPGRRSRCGVGSAASRGRMPAACARSSSTPRPPASAPSRATASSRSAASRWSTGA